MCTLKSNVVYRISFFKTGDFNKRVQPEKNHSQASVHVKQKKENT